MENKVEGKWNEVKGDVTGDESDKLKGQAQQKVGDAQDAVHDLTEDKGGDGTGS